MINLPRLARESVEELFPLIIRLNKEQLDEGTDMKLKGLGYYSENTLMVKENAGRPAKSREVSLLDTGDFRNAITPNIQSNSLIVESKDWKQEILEAEYGKYITGVPEGERRVYFISKLREVFINKILNFLRDA